jgi:hypothetical protein
MISLPQNRLWDQAVPDENQLRTMVTFLVGTMGFVLVSLLLWAVLHIVTRA